MTQLVVVSDDGPVRTVRMNRPEKKNALTADMYRAMAEAIEAVAHAPATRCLLLAGAPGAFSAGNDLQDFLIAAKGGQGLAEPVLRFMYSLVRTDKPVVAAVDGLAVGIGTTMLMHCDFVVAAEGSRFSTPFVSLGLVPEYASSLVGPGLMGHRKAFSLLVMGRPLDAAGARDAGLVNAVVPSAQVEETANAAAREIAALPPEAVAASRQLLRGDPAAILARIDEEAELYRVRLQTPEARAAFERFLNRKK